MLIPLALAFFQSANAERCADKCAKAIASDGNKAMHTSLMADCGEYLGKTYYPTTRYFASISLTLVRGRKI
jgi:Tfp pilus assembly protein PilF